MGNSLNIVLSAFIILACLVFIYFVQFTDALDNNIQENEKLIFTILMSIYAGFRIFRLYKLIQSSKKQS
ncbi:MAG: hypothetical protein IT221_04850 [Fluviicola sp.]|nr:hypothetical protein [Fluviicola sp.]